MIETIIYVETIYFENKMFILTDTFLFIFTPNNLSVFKEVNIQILKFCLKLSI